MYLIFDTETTDLYNKNLSATDPRQARICQFACMLLDKGFNELATFSSLIKPKGWCVQPGAESVHGISTEKCDRYGLSIDIIIEVLLYLSQSAKFMVAHNAKFDLQMLDVEFQNAQLSYKAFDSIICTMELMTPICKLNNPKRPTQYKWPKLVEAYRHVTNKEFDGAHDALADVKACSTILHYLVSNNHIII